MTQSCLNTHILNTQCLQKDLVNTYLEKLKIGKVCKEAEWNMLMVQEYIESLYNYTPFDDTVTYAYTFTITREGEGNVVLTITIGTETFTYDGNEALEAILSSLETSFLGADDYTFQVEIIDDVLYIYSYDDALTFGTTTTVSTSSESEATIEKDNIQNTYCTILDNKNCLTSEELCDIIEHSHTLLEDCNC